GMKDQRGKRRVAAGTASADDESLRIGLALRDQVSRRVHRVFDVNDAPLAIQTLSIRAAVPGTPTIVHVGDREAARRPVLNCDIEPRRRRRRRAAVADDNERRSITAGTGVLGMSRWIDERVRRQTTGGWKFDRFRLRNVDGIDLDG